MKSIDMPPTATYQPDCPEDAELAQVLDAYLADLEAGRPMEPNQVVAEHPAIADRLRACLIGLHQLEHGSEILEPVSEAKKAAHREAGLGDYRLTREVGRGGMGIVYEAEQISLGRRVALKVLPFAAALDPKQLQRFKNEAQAAAQLHHTNIVPVFCVGCERGVHYYAMQFIEGHTLADLVRRLRQDAGRPERGLKHVIGRTAPGESHATSVQSASLEGEPTIPYEPAPEPAPKPSSETVHQVGSATPTPLAAPPAAFYRTVARWGVQAAEALEHAHQMGVIHRDVKPANLMVDGRGQLWVTDFGLARFHSEAGLTGTGDLMGTLRYASPEQARGRPGAVDHRTDVYSLGVTLYELLTLEHAFDGQERPELLRQIVSEEPVPPRRRNRAVPADLETIVLKAMEKDPADRYETAQELAGDLQHFLDDKPINARRPTLLQRLRRWGRRHQPQVWSAVVFGLLTLGVVAASIGWIARDRAAREGALDDQVGRILDGAEGLLTEGKWPEAKSALEQVEKLLAVAGRTEPPARFQELRRDVAMAERLEEVYGLELEDYQAQDLAYAEAFREYGIDLAVLAPAEAAELIRARPIRLELVRALDFWASLRRPAHNQGSQDWKDLLAIAKAVDLDPWRNRLREALEGDDHNTLKMMTMVESTDVRQLPPQTLVLLGRILADPSESQEKAFYGSGIAVLPSGQRVIHLKQVGGFSSVSRDQAVRLLRKAQAQYPADLWINKTLGYSLFHSNDNDGALRFYTAALALRPHSPSIIHSLGWVFLNKRAYAEAITAFSKAIDLKSENRYSWCFRGEAYMQLGELNLALSDVDKSIQLDPTDPYPRHLRARVLERLGKWDEAISEFSQVIDTYPPRFVQVGPVPSRILITNPEFVSRLARLDRAYAYSVLGQWDRAATDLDPKHRVLTPRDLESTIPDDRWFQFACLRLLQGDVPGYQRLCQRLLEYQQSLERNGRPRQDLTGDGANLASRIHVIHPVIGPSQRAQGVRWAEKAAASDPKRPWYLHTLALAHYRAGQFKEAVQRSHDSLNADPHWGGTPLNWLLLGIGYQRLGQPEQARQWMDKATAWRERACGGSSPKGEPATPPDVHLNEWLEFQVLYREAEELLNQAEAAK